MMRAVVWLCQWVLVLMCATPRLFGDDTNAAPFSISATNAAAVELRGQLVRLSEKSNERVGLRTESGIIYSVYSNHMSSALFIDTNFLGKTLVLKGREIPKANRFEVTGNLRSLRGGKVHNVFYYCDICSVEGIDPGPCVCCRDPVHLIEEPTK